MTSSKITLALLVAVALLLVIEGVLPFVSPEAVRRAFAQPRSLAMNLVAAQEGRRVLDRLVGYKISPILWKNVKRGISAGRVQSVTVRLIVEREREPCVDLPETLEDGGVVLVGTHQALEELEQARGKSIRLAKAEAGLAASGDLTASPTARPIWAPSSRSRSTSTESWPANRASSSCSERIRSKRWRSVRMKTARSASTSRRIG